MLVSEAVLPLLFYGILTPIYQVILREKISNVKGFYLAWITAPFLVGYFFYSTLVEVFLLLIFNVIGYIIVLKNKYKYIFPLLLFSAVIIQIFYILTTLHTIHG
ncbi:hypothetical protein SUSAZ_06590 [Sulfolobus acidocaldarius SUSAZ]|nr:hypothetical protein SUSAZ_06590 [Sulfolobus acidocaldarius SUSAZ]